MFGDVTPRWRWWEGIVAAVWVGFVFFALPPASAQDVPREGAPIHIGHAGATAVGTVALFLLDEPLRDLLQSNRTEFVDDLAAGLRQLGEIGVVYPASFGVFAAGVLASDSELRRTGAQMAASLTLAAGITVAGKFIFGRARPYAEEGAWSYQPFKRTFHKAFPSGHTALAFALATTLADLTDEHVARMLFFAAASGTAWSRLNDDRHWLSDVGVGAVVGIMSSKLVTGRWTIFGVETPDYFARPGVNRVNVGEMALSVAAGVAVFRVVQLVVSSAWDAAPLVGPLSAGEWVIGMRVNY